MSPLLEIRNLKKYFEVKTATYTLWTASTFN